MSSDLLGIAEIAELADVSKQAVSFFLSQFSNMHK
jgi:predicted DNA-binding protein YlxM (UPF0122 family)